MSNWHLKSRHSSPIFSPDTEPDIPPPGVDPDTDAQLCVCLDCGLERGRAGAGRAGGGRGAKGRQPGAGGRNQGGRPGLARDA